MKMDGGVVAALSLLLATSEAARLQAPRTVAASPLFVAGANVSAGRGSDQQVLKEGKVAQPTPGKSEAIELIDWRFAKLWVGIALLLPAIPTAVRWLITGHPPSPFLLANASTTWRGWVFDSVRTMAIVGADLIMLGGAEIDWDFTMTCILIFILLYFGVIGFSMFLYSVLHDESPYSRPKGSEVEREPLVAFNRYQDLNVSMISVLSILMCQLICMSFYAKETLRKVPLGQQQYKYFAAAVPFQIIARGLLGPSFCRENHFWHALLRVDERAKLKSGHEGSETLVEMHYYTTLLRAFMSYFSNCLCIATVVLTFPMFMMSAGSDIDFVKDSFAVVFISSLDDVSADVEFHLRFADPPTDQLNRRNTAQ